MYYGILGVSAIAFSCSTEFVPEINEKMRLVPFTSEFKTTMTAIMVIDFLGCYVIEKVLKFCFSDFKPKDIAIRRKDQLEREEKRKEEERKVAEKEASERMEKQIRELEEKQRAAAAAARDAANRMMGR